jgi:flagellar basal-body rod protein FlgF
MENSIYTGLSRQMALRSNMDIIANNIANMNTAGYRSQNMVFAEFMEETKDSNGKKDTLSMVLDYGHYQNTASGPMQKTSNPLDVALEGPGYFGVQTKDGTTMYSRAGSFQTNTEGELITGAGDLVASVGGGPISIPRDAKEILVDEKGVISTESGQVGQLMIVEFDNAQELEAMGNGLYKTDATANPAQNTRSIQGMLEGSNVNSVLEMTRMIDVLRSYQSTHKLLQGEHERQRNMIRQLSRNG